MGGGGRGGLVNWRSSCTCIGAVQSGGQRRHMHASDVWGSCPRGRERERLLSVYLPSYGSVLHLYPGSWSSLSSADVFHELQRHPEAGSSWPSWPKASNPPRELIVHLRFQDSTQCQDPSAGKARIGMTLEPLPGIIPRGGLPTFGPHSARLS